MNDETKEGFVKIKMPKYYTAKYSYEDLRAAVLAEREACARLCESEGHRIDASWESCAAAIRARGDMSTKSQNVNTSEERVHESDISIHDDDDIQEYKRPWIGLSDEEAAIYSNVFNGIRLVREIEAQLKERNNG